MKVTRTSIVMVALLASSIHAGEIGYIEDFALTKDREAALKQLIPGTRDYYYYHSLHFQNTEQFDKVEEILKPWVKRYNYTSRVWEIKNRQALLLYEKNPRKSLEYIRGRLGINFNHQRDSINKNRNLPIALDQGLISRARLIGIANSNYSNTSGYEDSALEWLVTTNLNSSRRRHLLQRLQRPDYPNLPKLIVDDLNTKYSRGFGSFTIHRQLLPEQLEACLKLKPDLLNQTHFVNTYITKLRPNPDTDWVNDADARKAYLDRLWKFVSRLAPVHNSLRAHAMYHRLVFDRSLGVYDKSRFMTYIKLPRHTSYINAKYMKIDHNRKYACNLRANYQSVTMLPIIGDDEPLVRSYFHHFFVKETSYKPYEQYINDLYLKYNFAETKIVNGLGDMEQWYSMLPPQRYQSLKERIDLDFAYTNKQLFGATEPVSIDLDVKNVKQLLVKVYHINAGNFYRDNLREVNTDINLDGLIANSEVTHEYKLPPLRRARRHFEFAELTKPGVYVIDFIGNGKSSRVLVRKGKLRHIARVGSAGHVLTILDEDNKKQKGASVWLAGHEYTADEDGEITIPFSNRPGRQPIIIAKGDLSSFDYLNQSSENYSMVAGIYVDRESLLSRRKTRVVIRPALYLNGNPVSLKLLEDVRLGITSIDHDGVQTTKEVSAFKLHEDNESTYEFQTPHRMQRVSFILKAKVQNLSQNKKLNLSSGQTFSLNQIDRTEKTENLHFTNIAGSYAVELLGRTGEARPQRPIHLYIKHRDFKRTVNVVLQTDVQGRVTLGALADIQYVKATGPQGTSHTWHLPTDRHTYHSTVHGHAGGTIRVPYMGEQKAPARNELSLLEARHSVFVADWWKNVSIANGYVTLNKLPRGDYDLLLKNSKTRINVRVAEGKPNEQGTYVLSENRQLEVRNPSPLQIESVKTDKDNVTVKLQNASKFARVHVFATRYQPIFSAYGNLGSIGDPEPYLVTVPKTRSAYMAGRNIGDEYRYILDRRFAHKYPGNMLKRPSVLLNPWAKRKTETGEQVAKGGEDFRRAAPPAKGAGRRGQSQRGGKGSTGDFANLDFLSKTSAMMANLAADKDGVITIKREDLIAAGHRMIHVVAVDAQNTVYRAIAIDKSEDPNYIDLRLVDGLDPKLHYTEQKQVSIIGKGGAFELGDITSSKFEVYDRLARAYQLYATLSDNNTLREFSFVLGWPKLKREQKNEKYSKYACHELNFFLYKKDPEYFRQVVLPFLANKKDKTFMDRWLLGENLSSYLKPWSFEQLNTVERILLSQRIQGEQQYTSRHVVDMYNLIPPNIDHFNHLFRTAIKSSALDANDDYGLGKQLGLVKPAEEFKSLERLHRLGPAADAPADSAAPVATGAAPPSVTKAPARPVATPKPMAKKKSQKEAQLRDMIKGDKKLSNLDIAGVVTERTREWNKEKDEEARKSTRQYYRKLDKTQEWAENNYYHLPIEQQNASLITVNGFWRDYAKHNPNLPGEPFFSKNLAEAARNFPEMMLALSVLDLPFEAEKHDVKFDKAKMTMTSASPFVVYHRQVNLAKGDPQKTPVLVSQNFFRHGDRYKMVDNEKVDKYVTDEFLVHTVYGCQVVVTNPTSTRQKLDILLQIPRGAIAVLNGQATKSVHVDLQQYSTRSLEYYFYFPTDGKYQHYPVHVAKNEQVIAHAPAVTLKVVNELSRIDKESWDYVSQHGTENDVIDYLNANNLHDTRLDRIAWRMKDGGFFAKVVGLLTQRHAYNHTLWSYGIRHNALPAVREYLQHANGFVNQCGQYIDSKPLTIDPVVRKMYEHLDYSPLVNARAHQLGKRRHIVNERVLWQHHRLMKIFSYKRDLDDHDLMATTYYMLLQDRAEDAMGYFKRVNPAKIPTKIQYDYFTAYIDFYSDDHKLARGIADKYLEHPVDRWRNLFANVSSQLDEIDGKGAVVVDKEDRTQAQTKLAASSSSFEFKVESKKITVNYQNVDSLRVNYYLMDVELLFSTSPFVEQSGGGQFSYIRPNASTTIKLEKGGAKHEFDLPKRYHSSNVLVEITAGGETKSQAYYSNSLALQLLESYGQVRVAHEATGKPIPKTYVKVYAQMRDGRVKFYKDGYTDLRGRFDYTSLNTNELDNVSRFALLIHSDKNGAVVREAVPPKR